MDNEELKILLDRYFAGQCTPQEKRWVERAYNLQDSVYQKEISEGRFEQMKAEVWSRLDLGNRMPAGKVHRLWPKVAVAVAVTFIALCVYFFNFRKQDPRVQTPAVLASDIAPGRNGATISLAGGRVIELSSRKTGVVVGEVLTYSDGTEVLGENIGGELTELTASTAKGQTYDFILPDGTKVWLNADSRISFPSRFDGKQRKVLLTGEAYFAVRHDAARPFSVESKGQVVEDIGTEFNIQAYAGESVVRTTLVEGLAKVNGVPLNPNEQASLDHGEIRVKEVDAKKAIAWKKGKFVFDEEDLESIMTKLSRWYDVEVIYQDDVRARNFTASISRFDHISKILDKLSYTNKVHFKIEGRRIFVMK